MFKLNTKKIAINVEHIKLDIDKEENKVKELLNVDDPDKSR